MPSILSNPVPVSPQQERSTRRLAGFLDAAAELFVEGSYEAATMTAVAEPLGSSIGALCNYFPDKQSIACTLVNQYSQELEAHWKPLMEQAEILTHAEFADRFIERITPIRPGASRLSDPGRANPSHQCHRVPQCLALTPE
jgi:AcrR family transcriptional regulator